jgi:hypothetical protein
MKKRYDEARRVIRKIADANGYTIKDYKFIEEKEHEDKRKKRKELTKENAAGEKKSQEKTAHLKVPQKQKEDDESEKDEDDVLRSSLGGTLEHYLLVQNIVDQKSSLRHSINTSLVGSFQGPRKAVLYTYIDLFRYKSLLKVSLILSYAYFAVYLCYYGAIFCLNSLGGDIYYSAIYVNCAELAAYVVSGNKIKL